MAVRIHLPFDIDTQRDDNLLDQTKSDPTVNVDIVIEISKIQYAVDAIKNATEFLREVEILHDKIPVVQSSINDLIAGEGRSMADMFDFTGELKLTSITVCCLNNKIQ